MTAIPEGWLRAIDKALITSHLCVAYERGYGCLAYVGNHIQDQRTVVVYRSEPREEK